MNRWRQRLAELHGDGGEPPSPIPSAVQNVQNVQNPLSAPTFEHFEQIEQPTDAPVPPLAPARDRALATWGEREAERAAIVEHDAAIPRIGIPEIPDEPPLLLDGRRSWRFSQGQDCTPDHAAALIEQAHWCGAVLVADGQTLIIVERWLSSLPVETLCELRRCASGVIEALHRWSRIRHQADARRLGDR